MTPYRPAHAIRLMDGLHPEIRTSQGDSNSEWVLVIENQLHASAACWADQRVSSPVAARSAHDASRSTSSPNSA